MPRRGDLGGVLVLGSGPIVIGQACEFDYSGTQAVKALKREGYRVVLVNSNPATIMTDPELADATYLEPLCAERVECVIAQERPDALLATVGGQTALNLAVELAERGALSRHGVELIGVGVESIRLAEDRERFKAAVESVGLRVPRSYLLRSLDETDAAVAAVGFPAILRASFTLGGAGSGNVEVQNITDLSSDSQAITTGQDNSLIIGMVEILAQGYVSSPMRDAIVFSVLIIVLLYRPTGLFGEAATEKA